VVYFTDYVWIVEHVLLSYTVNVSRIIDENKGELALHVCNVENILIEQEKKKRKEK
jgi:hypothetical protein